jgi:hypothetical protein
MATVLTCTTKQVQEVTPLGKGSCQYMVPKGEADLLQLLGTLAFCSNLKLAIMNSAKLLRFSTFFLLIIFAIWKHYH